MTLGLLLLRIARKLSRLSCLLYKLISARKPSLLSDHDQLITSFQTDAMRFQRAAWYESRGSYRAEKKQHMNSENLSAIITMEYHRIEKGLALPARRVGASQDVVRRLIEAISVQYDERGPTDEGSVALRVLEVYFDETPKNALTHETTAIFTQYEELREKYSSSGRLMQVGGYSLLTSKEITDLVGEQYSEFIISRHSIRDYRDGPVDERIIREVARTAIKSPSVCNRQAWRLYAITEKERIQEALSLQNGNRGFTERVPLLFVVTADLRRFVSVEERNQAWIDGGLFSMTLMLAIHAKGLGACPLNWCASKANDEALRRQLDIPEHEVVIMMLSAGHLPESIKITASPRREIESILQFVS